MTPPRIIENPTEEKLELTDSDSSNEGKPRKNSTKNSTKNSNENSKQKSKNQSKQSGAKSQKKSEDVSVKRASDSGEFVMLNRGDVDAESYLTPKQIVAELDKYIVGQNAAKKSVAIALRNRWRRRRSPEDIRNDILPNNIIMIGQTGVGKTEIARRLADLVGAPFIKVEASKFTEVGYVGRDVESMIRDLVDLSVNIVRKELGEAVKKKAGENTDDRLLDILLPRKPRKVREPAGFPLSFPNLASSLQGPDIGPEDSAPDTTGENETETRTREKFRKMLLAGKLDHRTIEINVTQNNFPVVEIFTPQGMEEMGASFQEMFSGLIPKKTRNRKTTVAEARKILFQEEVSRLVNMDDVVSEALRRAQESGIIFLDEIDKIAGEKAKSGPDVSREGVQRDILPIVEGSTVSTKYGMVNTYHILFIAAGAFHSSSPADLIPELQGRFPIRVELESLTAADFKRILTEPKNALVKQYQALLQAEGVKLTFTDEAVEKMAELAEQVNTTAENIGARRLHTIMSALLEDVMFHSPGGKKTVTVSGEMVSNELKDLVEDEDLSRYML